MTDGVPRAAADDRGAFGALWGVLFEPARTFSSLASRPRWWLPFILITGLAVALSALVTPRIDMREVLRGAMEKSGREITSEQLEQQVTLAENFSWVGTASQAVLQPAIYLLIAAVFLALFRMFGSDLDFRQSLAVTTHAFMPFVVATVLSFPVVLSRTEIDMDEVRGGGFLKSNLAALAPDGTGSTLLSVLGSLDLFSLWTLALFATGYRIVARVSRGQAWGVVLALWALYVAGKTAITAVF